MIFDQDEGVGRVQLLEAGSQACHQAVQEAADACPAGAIELDEFS